MICNWKHATQTSPVSTWTQATGDTNYIYAVGYVISQEYLEEKEEPLRYEYQFPLQQKASIRIWVSFIVVKPKFMLLRDAGWRYRCRVKKSGRKILMHRIT